MMSEMQGASSTKGRETSVGDEAKLREYLEKVTVDLRRERRRVVDLEQRAQEPIAIIGMSCRYPGGVGSPEQLWRLVEEAGDGIGRFPADRGWDLEGIYDPEPDAPGACYAREGGFLDDAAGFDAGLLRDQSPRGAGDRPPAAIAAGRVLGGARECRARPSARCAARRPASSPA